MDVFIEKKIIFIQPAHGMTYMDMKTFGYNVDTPYYDFNLILRLIREVWFKANFPFKKIWFNKKINSTFDVIVIYDPLIINEFVQWIKKKNPKSRVIFVYNNPIKNDKEYYNIDENNCEKWSWNEIDCERFGMKKMDGMYFKEHLNIDKTSPSYDVVFVGKDKGRLGYLLELKNKMEKLNIKVFLYITADRRFKFIKKRIYKKYIPYKEVLSIVGKSRAILDVNQEGQTGITLRVREAMIYGTKLITNNHYIKNHKFYNKNNIFILGEDEFNDLRSFIYSDFVTIDNELLEYYEFRNAWNRYLL